MSGLIGFCFMREQIGPIHVGPFYSGVLSRAAEGRPFPCDKAHFLNLGAPNAALAAPPCRTCHIYKGLRKCACSLQGMKPTEIGTANRGLGHVTLQRDSLLSRQSRFPVCL